MLILANALQWINPADYDKLLIIVPYRWQLIIYLIIILLLVVTLLYRKAFPIVLSNEAEKLKDELRNDGGAQTNNHEITMKNLSPAEASILMIFLNSESKVILTQYDSIVKILIRNDVLSCLKYNDQSVSEISIREWAWEWINKNEDELKAKL